MQKVSCWTTKNAQWLMEKGKKTVQLSNNYINHTELMTQWFEQI